VLLYWVADLGTCIGKEWFGWLEVRYGARHVSLIVQNGEFVFRLLA